MGFQSMDSRGYFMLPQAPRTPDITCMAHPDRGPDSMLIRDFSLCCFKWNANGNPKTAESLESAILACSVEGDSDPTVRIRTGCKLMFAQFVRTANI